METDLDNRAVDVHETGDVETYAAAVTPYLRARPTSCNVLLWIIELARGGRTGWDAEPYFFWVGEAAETVAAASWTSPFNAHVSGASPAAIAALAAAVFRCAAATSRRVRGVTGPRAQARVFADTWTALSGEAAREHMLETLYAATAVRQVPSPAGSRATAAPDETGRLAQWLEAFVQETGVPSGTDMTATVRSWIEERLCDVWLAGDGIASMCVHREPVAGVVRVGPVYTPPELRGRGYARRLVAEVTGQALSRSEVSHCVLYADAANPVSNSIYRQVGYVPREEHVDIVFGDLPDPP
jgi:predicted GNAT family acetyltransferase